MPRDVLTAERWQYLLANRRVTEDGCWEWTGYRNARGYGRVMARPHGRFLVHRLALAYTTGEDLDGLVVDHLCGNPPCFNPDHLDATTQRINLARGDTFNSENLAKTHCKHGHEFTPENTYVNPGDGRYGGSRKCRTCMRANDRKRKARP